MCSSDLQGGRRSSHDHRRDETVWAFGQGMVHSVGVHLEPTSGDALTTCCPRMPRHTTHNFWISNYWQSTENVGHVQNRLNVSTPARKQTIQMGRISGEYGMNKTLQNQVKPSMCHESRPKLWHTINSTGKRMSNDTRNT